jgi:hypothetical protein
LADESGATVLGAEKGRLLTTTESTRQKEKQTGDGRGKKSRKKSSRIGMQPETE